MLAVFRDLARGKRSIEPKLGHEFRTNDRVGVSSLERARADSQGLAPIFHGAKKAKGESEGVEAFLHVLFLPRSAKTFA
jgi:hypothetical protein